jgi:hypothetical protein
MNTLPRKSCDKNKNNMNRVPHKGIKILPPAVPVFDPRDPYTFEYPSQYDWRGKTSAEYLRDAKRFELGKEWRLYEAGRQRDASARRRGLKHAPFTLESSNEDFYILEAQLQNPATVG